LELSASTDSSATGTGTETGTGTGTGTGTTTMTNTQPSSEPQKKIVKGHHKRVYSVPDKASILGISNAHILFFSHRVHLESNVSFLVFMISFTELIILSLFEFDKEKTNCKMRQQK
jgi:hypothetical protein